MLELISKAMGKQIHGGRQALLDALQNGGIQTDYIEEDDTDDEIGEAFRANEV